MKTKTLLLFGIGLFFCSLLIAETVDYYPLKIGNKWTYKFGNKSSTQIIEIIKYEENDNAFVFQQTTLLGTFAPMTVSDLISKKSKKVNRIASMPYGSYAWEYLSKPEVILQFPLSIGSTWKTAYHGDKETFKVLSKITLKVSAGEFKNVFKIKLVTQVGEGQVTSYRYYAPNVGLIKEEMAREDGTISTIIELKSYKLK